MLLLASFFALLLISMIDMHSQHAVRSVSNFFDVVLWHRTLSAMDAEALKEATQEDVLSSDALTRAILSCPDVGITHERALAALTCLYLAVTYERVPFLPRYAHLGAKDRATLCDKYILPDSSGIAYQWPPSNPGASLFTTHMHMPRVNEMPMILSQFDLYLDSGASHNYVNNVRFLRDPVKCNMRINASKRGVTMEATKRGHLGATNLVAYYVPDLGPNLLSLAQLTNNGFEVSFKSMTITRRGRLLTKIVFMKHINMFKVSLRTPLGPQCPPADMRVQPHALRLSHAAPNLAVLWHNRLNHVNKTVLRMMNVKLQLGIPLTHFKAMNFCTACALAKARKASPFRKTMRRRLVRASTPQSTPGVVHKPLEMFLMDIFGPVTPASPSGHMYGAISVDKMTGQIIFCPLKSRSDVLLALKDLRELHVMPYGKRLMCLRTDNAPEMKHGVFESYCRAHGIRREYGTPHFHAEQGRAEKAIHDLVTSARALLVNMGAPSTHWVAACYAAAHVHALMPRQFSPSPLQMTHGCQPSVKHLRTFWSPVFVYQQPNERFKSHRFKPVSLAGRFYGYTTSATQYKVHINGRVYHRRTVIFNEDSALVWARHPESAAVDPND